MIRAPKSPLILQVIMPGNALYTDLSGYYDLMCADIDYQTQSQCIQRLQQLFGNAGKHHLDLACGTGPHVRHFIDAGYQSSGLDINQPMLDRAMLRCPEARFSMQDMCSFKVAEPLDLITCFLYSIHYSAGIDRLKACIASVHGALKRGGLFCFNAVDKNLIDNHSFVSHSARHENSLFNFSSAWHYHGTGSQQSLKLSIQRTMAGETQVWHDEHPMVAVGFAELQALLQPYFEVHVLEHDYSMINPWDRQSGNALFACVKI
ncbi:Methyltransferase domain-containing protein [Pseudomonas segetis]|uniref:Methyltransferase domain-containing protein n=2 Tax=Pseudomonas segetis TaxID=298908 RepID=A0A239BXV8_9PSED|nr:Methyltransferase domain-containing protein [Pseudomonas segetis]